MKNFIFLFILIFSVQNCSIAKTQKTAETHTLKPTKNDDGEWDLYVLDDRYDYFLNAIAKPMNFYTESYLKSRNAILVSEWNSLYYSGRYRNIIESSIDYNPLENYGLKFEYKLYQVFAYVYWRYGLKLNGLSNSEVR